MAENKEPSWFSILLPGACRHRRPFPQLAGALLAEEGEAGDSRCEVVEEGSRNCSLSCQCVSGVPESWVCGIHFLISVSLQPRHRGYFVWKNLTLQDSGGSQGHVLYI